MSLLGLFNLRGGEIILILALILILFGARTLPGLAKDIGEANGPELERFLRRLYELIERYARLFGEVLRASFRQFRKGVLLGREVSPEARVWDHFEKQDLVNMITFLLLGLLAVAILALFVA